LTPGLTWIPSSSSGKKVSTISKAFLYSWNQFNESVSVVIYENTYF
jgi:hypothetical protein